MERLKAPLTICKRKAKSWGCEFLELIYPPLCSLCRSSSKESVCPSCRDLLTLIDPQTRCRHCFDALENRGGLCRKCAHSPLLSAPHAYLFEPTHVASQLKSNLTKGSTHRLLIASLLVMQHHNLKWPLPDRIAMIPNAKKHKAMQEISEEFARMLGLSFSDEFRLYWSAPFTWSIQRKKDDLLENQTVILLDFDSPATALRQALSELWPAFPKKIYILSVFSHRSYDRTNENA